MTPDQLDALAKARESALRLKRFADKARSMGLPVMESHLRDASVACQMAADFQEAAMKQPDAQVAKAEALGFRPHEETKDAKLADTIADTMKRRGLV